MIGTAQFTCVCCGAKLPGTRQELIARGAATIQGHSGERGDEKMRKYERHVAVFGCPWWWKR